MVTTINSRTQATGIISIVPGSTTVLVPGSSINSAVGLVVGSEATRHGLQ